MSLTRGLGQAQLGTEIPAYGQHRLRRSERAEATAVEGRPSAGVSLALGLVRGGGRVTRDQRLQPARFEEATCHAEIALAEQLEHAAILRRAQIQGFELDQLRRERRLGVLAVTHAAEHSRFAFGVLYVVLEHRVTHATPDSERQRGRGE
jgi:hypothetical protein